MAEPLSGDTVSDTDIRAFNEKYAGSLALVAAAIAAIAAIAQLGFLVLVCCVGRNDKSVRQAGLGFLIYLIVGGLCGQGIIMAQAGQLYQVSEADAGAIVTGMVQSWEQCHAQPMLMLLHLGFHASPLSAKLCRVWFNIRVAETRKLQCAAAAAAKKTHASAPARERTRETHVHERG